MRIPLQSIQRDTGLQMRVKEIDRAIVRQYAEAMKRGETLPAIVLFVDEAGRLWPGDGWHRIAAHESLALSEIEADVRPGGRPAAFRFALSANAKHGLRRTQADRRYVVQQALRDEELRQQSDRALGELCGVDHKTVGKIRGEMFGGELWDTKRRGLDGRVRKVRVEISPLGEKARADSAPGGAGGAAAREKAAGFNVVTAMHGLEGSLAAEFETWPEEKRHAFCVALANFAKLHDPEIQSRTQDALDEMLTRREEERRG